MKRIKSTRFYEEFKDIRSLALTWSDGAPLLVEYNPISGDGVILTGTNLFDDRYCTLKFKTSGGDETILTLAQEGLNPEEIVIKMCDVKFSPDAQFGHFKVRAYPDKVDLLY